MPKSESLVVVVDFLAQRLQCYRQCLVDAVISNRRQSLFQCNLHAATIDETRTVSKLCVCFNLDCCKEGKTLFQFDLVSIYEGAIVCVYIYIYVYSTSAYIYDYIHTYMHAVYYGFNHAKIPDCRR